MSALTLTATGTVTAVIGMAAMYIPARLARHDARTDRALAEEALTMAEERDAAFERTRTLPWFWSFDQADADHDAELLHIEYPTQELRLVAADPQFAAGLAALADEVGLAQALDNGRCCIGHGDEPCGEDSGLVPPYCCDDCPDRTPALSDRLAEDDEVGDEQPGETWFAALARIWSRLRDWWQDEVLARLKSDEQLAREFDARIDDAPWVLYDEDELRAQGVSELELKMLREGYVSLPYDEAADAEARALEVEAWRAANPVTPEPQPQRHGYRRPGETGQYPHVQVVGDKAAGRHRAEVIPAQHEGEVAR